MDERSEEASQGSQGSQDSQALAERSVRQMWSTDAASRALGMELLEVAPGRATIAMTIGEHMVNGWAVAHGGLVASLADSAFAAACNSRGILTVAAGFCVDFLEPVREDDRLVATAREVWLRGRAGLYDVTVRREPARTRRDAGAAGDGGVVVGAGDVVAEFRGRSRSTGRTIGEA